MAEIKQFKPSTKESPKPEKPADVIDIESAKKKVWSKEFSGDTSSILADALELARAGQLTEKEIAYLRSINEDEKILLGVIANLFDGLRKKDETIDELRELIRKLKKIYGEKEL